MFIKFNNKDSGLPVVVNINKIDTYYQHDTKTLGIAVNGVTFQVECSMLSLEQIMQDNGYDIDWEV